MLCLESVVYINIICRSISHYQSCLVKDIDMLILSVIYYSYTCSWTWVATSIGLAMNISTVHWSCPYHLVAYLILKICLYYQLKICLSFQSIFIVLHAHCSGTSIAIIIIGNDIIMNNEHYHCSSIISMSSDHYTALDGTLISTYHS